MRRDLVVLVPDKDIEQAIAGLLGRYENIGIRPITIAQIVVHPNRDPGVCHTGHELLQPFADDTEQIDIVTLNSFNISTSDKVNGILNFILST